MLSLHCPWHNVLCEKQTLILSTDNILLLDEKREKYNSLIQKMDKLRIIFQLHSSIYQ